jgi:hypothetical protein
MTDFSVLKGKIISSVDGLEKGSDVAYMHCEDGKSYMMFHNQNCCESVDIDDVEGNIEDILNSPILLAEEVISGDNPKPLAFEYQPDSWTWTFYKLSTIKGSITIKWFGCSNGYYSESVDFEEIISDERDQE